jgi:putative CRISPR-associated protein (TIGR02620 family)
MIDVIVTRHSGLVEYLKEIELADNFTAVISHATPENVVGRDVCGVLPHSLSCLTNSFTEVPLALPAELRGKELSLEEVRQYAGKPVTYQVRRV